MPRVAAAVLGVALLLVVLADAFSTMVLARRSSGVLRLTRSFYRATWTPYAYVGRRIRAGQAREEFLGVYGPLSLLMLIATWALALVLAFGVLQWSAGLVISGRHSNFLDALFVSAAGLVTMVVGVPDNAGSKFLLVLEASVGFTFLALVIGYLPVLYQSFSSREQRITMLDPRAGSPPSAAVFLRRLPRDSNLLAAEFEMWEEWAAEILQHQLSYPMLAFFRSQHADQSWLSALTAVTDASAVAMLCADGDLRHQSELTFATCRHTLTDLAAIFCPGRIIGAGDRLSPEQLKGLAGLLKDSPAALDPARLDPAALAGVRQLYEPDASRLSRHFLVALPPWIPEQPRPDNWAVAERQPEHQDTVSDPFQSRDR